MTEKELNGERAAFLHAASLCRKYRSEIESLKIQRFALGMTSVILAVVICVKEMF